MKALWQKLMNSRAGFFRESGWLLVATVVSGLFMYAVHLLARKIGPAEYGVFLWFVGLSIFIPAMPLQLVMAQQSAHGLAIGAPERVRGIFRFLFWCLTAVWLVVIVAATFSQGYFVRRLSLSSSAPLWAGVLVLWCSAMLPVGSGLLQGRQNFFWLGSVALVNGFNRVLIAAVAVWFLHAGATGMLIGVAIGITGALTICLWQVRDLVFGTAEPCDWRKLARESGPLLLAFAAFQFLFTADTIFAGFYVKNAGDLGLYGSAGTLARGLMWLVGPLSTIMFPRLVASVARSEKGELLTVVAGGTAVLAVLGATCLAVIGRWVIPLVYGPDFRGGLPAQLLPWYAGAMVPLTIANVFLNHLMAVRRFGVALPLVLLAVGYGFAMTRFHAEPVQLLQVMAVSNSVLLVVTGGFYWVSRKHFQLSRSSESA